KEALDRLFTRMEQERVIPRDYLHLGMADVKLASSNGDFNQALFDEGIAQLKKAVAADSSIADDLHDLGMELFTAKKFKNAAQVFEIAASTPTSRNYVYDNFYMGFAGYYAVATTPADQRTDEDQQLLRKADAALGVVTEKAPTTQDAYLFRARVNNLLDDNENPEGLAVPYFEKYIEVVSEKGDAEVQKAKNNFIEIYNNLAAISAKNGEYQQARDYLGETLKLDPENAYANKHLLIWSRHLRQQLNRTRPSRSNNRETITNLLRRRIVISGVFFVRLSRINCITMTAEALSTPNDYLPILIQLIVAVGFGVGTIVITHLIGPKVRTENKLGAFESGIEVIGNARQPFSIKYFMVAILFVIFDIEVVFMYPWAVNFREFGLSGLIEMFVFMALLLLGFIYIIKRKALEWD